MAHPLRTTAAAALAVVLLGLALTACGGSGTAATPAAADAPSDAPAIAVPAAVVDEPAATGTSEVAVLAGGCFWGVEGVFEHVRGVTDVVSGYAGGTAATATYDQVSSHTTRHAEAVRITFDPRVTTYAELLRIYFAVAHDPTEIDRQGPDVGPQYRSAIFPTSSAQDAVARAYVDQLNAQDVFGARVVTTVETGSFYPAEVVHQDFMESNPENPYIVEFDAPKLVALERTFPDSYRAS